MEPKIRLKLLAAKSQKSRKSKKCYHYEFISLFKISLFCKSGGVFSTKSQSKRLMLSKVLQVKNFSFCSLPQSSHIPTIPNLRVILYHFYVRTQLSPKYEIKRFDSSLKISTERLTFFHIVFLILIGQEIQTFFFLKLQS